MKVFNAQRARAKRPLPLWIDAFHRDTQHLAADEVGAYFLILMAMWSRETCDLPDDNSRLAKICRVSKRLWDGRMDAVLRPFFSSESGSLISKRLRAEAARVEARVFDTSGNRNIPMQIRAAVVARDGGVCRYCGDVSGPFHLDHVQPFSRGGEHTHENLVVACVACNLAKGSRTAKEMGWQQ